MMETKNRLMNGWHSWYEAKKQLIKEYENFKKEAYGDKYEESTYEIKEIEYKQVVEVTEEIYQEDIFKNNDYMKFS